MQTVRVTDNNRGAQIGVTSLGICIRSGIGLIALAGGSALSGATKIVDSSVICAVAVQDRSPFPESTSGLDNALVRAIGNSGFGAITLAFDRPADVEYAARVKGCSHILYTDVVRATESAGSRTWRAIKRMIAAENVVTVTSEVEFRLFRVDEVLPLVSTSVTGKATARLSPHVSSRVVELHGEVVMPVIPKQPLRTTALSHAFVRQARIVSDTMLKPERRI